MTVGVEEVATRTEVGRVLRSALPSLIILAATSGAAWIAHANGWDYKAAMEGAAVLCLSVFAAGMLATVTRCGRPALFSLIIGLGVGHVLIAMVLTSQLAARARPMIEIPGATAVAQLVVVWILHRRAYKRRRQKE
ncbi:MAG: hypothetical protein AKCLJLPJ_00766 [Fimbriimonadales bacterium]|nr:MAG: hypothetical protein EDM73_12960 [Armatimonadota bacterium]MBV6502714.1 hypothetical protein [Fimbriimonadales bacterium]MCE7900982.1 hypothetical protein [Armatimonadetes bacterium ATM1]MDL1929770.1 hypothetical protein [Fimbriimonadia bacterium ATM]MBC6970846.1 hypothetical protein [Armatimonadota bacterium]